MRPAMSDDSSESRSGLPNAAGSPLRKLVGAFRRRRDDETLRETLEELAASPVAMDADPQEEAERQLLGNILKLRDVTVGKIMVPRADVVAIEASMSLNNMIEFITNEGHSRFPVYRGNLDEVVGMIHLKDLLPYVHSPQEFNFQQILREVIVIAPTMPVLDLLVEMRQSRRHMAVVVDEFGGVDGLVTIEDLVEEIVGEIEDEHDEADAHEVLLRPDGTIIANARLPLAELEARTGALVDDEAREDIDTIGGLLFLLAGRVPARGELIRHESGIVFEVMEADSRRVKRVRVRNIPKAEPAASNA